MARYVKYLIAFKKISLLKKLKVLRVVYIGIYIKATVRLLPMKLYYKNYLTLSNEDTIDLKPFVNEIRFIKRVLTILPINFTCLMESMVIKAYFKRKNIVIPVYVGVSSRTNISAHAWCLESDSQGYKKINFDNGKFY